LVVVFFLGAIALSCAWLYQDFAQDDAFITYRYARNLVTGYGFVYNPGESVLGTTTPLYTLLLALLALVSGQDIRLLGHFVSITSLWLSGAMLYSLGKNRDTMLAAAIALVFVTNPLLISAIGMETLFLVALMLMALKAYCSEKFQLTGLLLGLLVLTRLETALFAGLLGAHFLLQRRQLPYWLLIAVAASVPWLVFAWHTFGSVIPHSVQAKVIERAAGHGYSFPLGAVLWWGVYVNETLWYLALVPLVLFGIYEALKNGARSQAYALILAWTVVYFVAASFVAGSFPWYYGPLVPGFAIIVALGTDFLARVVNLLKPRDGRLTTDRLRTAAFCVITLGVLTLQLSSWSSDWVSFSGRVVDRRYVEGREVANWLNTHADEGESLAAEEIGVLGYFADIKIVDLYGLVTPNLLPYLEHGRAETLRQAITIYEPDYVLARHPDLIELLDESRVYERTETFSDGALILYRRTTKAIPEYPNGTGHCL